MSGRGISPETPEEWIAGVTALCKDRPCVFRGVNHSLNIKSEEWISTGIYHKYNKDKLFNIHFQPIDIEREVINNARRYFSPVTSDIEILTALRHLGAEMALLDFSRNLLVALFFACNGSFSKNGQVIVLDTGNLNTLREIDYERSSEHVQLIEPARTTVSRSRVEGQTSVFVRPPHGRFLLKEACTIIPVSHRLKKACLAHLRRFYHISTDTIYNDLIGFIENKENFETGQLPFYQGLAAHHSGDYDKAIGFYDKAIDNLDDSAAWNNRGIAKSKLDQHEDAIADYDQAIALDPENAKAWYNRGAAKGESGQYDDAQMDFEQALSLAQQSGDQALIDSIQQDMSDLLDTHSQEKATG